MDKSSILKFFSFLIPIITLCWGIFSYRRDTGRLQLRAYIADKIIPSAKAPKHELVVKMTNIGKRSIVVSRMGFLMKDGRKLMDSKISFLDKQLDPSEFLTISSPLEDLQSLFCYHEELWGLIVEDSAGKKWRLGNKDFKEILLFLKTAKRQTLLSSAP